MNSEPPFSAPIEAAPKANPFRHLQLSTNTLERRKIEAAEALAHGACGHIAPSQQLILDKPILCLCVAILSRLIGLIRGTQKELVVVSVPRRKEATRPSESEVQQQRAVPAGIATSPEASDNRQDPARREAEFFPEVRSVLRNTLRKRRVSSVPSAVALRKPAPVLRTRPLRTPELRTVASSTVVSAYPQSTPKDTLARVFHRMKRAARTEMFRRMSGRLASQSACSQPASPASAYPVSAYPVPASLVSAYPERLRPEFERPASEAAAGLLPASRRARHDA